MQTEVQLYEISLSKSDCDDFGMRTRNRLLIHKEEHIILNHVDNIPIAEI